MKTKEKRPSRSTVNEKSKEKKTATKYKSPALEALHSAVTDLHKGGAFTKETMRKFDDACLVEVNPLQPKEIKKLREGFHMSQSVFAAHINASASTVEKWEIGVSHPTGPALKLLHVVMRHGFEVLR